jgi:hypothetical protein
MNMLYLYDYYVIFEKRIGLVENWHTINVTVSLYMFVSFLLLLRKLLEIHKMTPFKVPNK